jgi:two-component system, NarL family, invasion response regulator UvrY
MDNTRINIGIVDDHSMIRQALSTLINNNSAYSVCLDAANGIDLQQKLREAITLPDILILDIAMPEMDGYETLQWLRKNHPGMKVLIMSISDSQEVLLQMVKLGANGFILKESELSEIFLAFDTIQKFGFYFTAKLQGYMTSIIKRGNLRHSIALDNGIEALNPQERRFLELLCTEMTYNEICELMHISYHTLDNYRDAVYRKLHVKSRTGSVLYAVKSGLIEM